MYISEVSDVQNSVAEQYLVVAYERINTQCGKAISFDYEASLLTYT